MPRRVLVLVRVLVWLLACAVAWPAPAAAQYFGRNKVQYRTFDFRILKTAHFDVYYYPEEAEAAGVVGRLAERWRARLNAFFEHALTGRQTIILYATASHFRQTNAIDELVGEGTGGVTEAVRRRIVLPMGGSLADTEHVLGHELVHAYQFDITGGGDRFGNGALPAILGYPLWFVEGMAEYVSLGGVDASTAMWVRDAVVTERLPRVRDLDKPEYFPYRWGHAFWAYVGATWGDRWIGSLLRSAADPRSDLTGFAAQLGTTPEELDAGWHAAMREAANAIVHDRPAVTSGVRRVIGTDAAGGRLNVGPRLSADGAAVAFFSERDLFSIDLYLADAVSGRIARKLLATANDPHFDSLQFLGSAGAWAPGGRTLALAASRRGKPVLVLLDVVLARVIREVPLDPLDDAIGPAWSPDGRMLVVTGNRGGRMDLYLVPVTGGALTRLTDDAYTELEAGFTPDGRSLVFSTDRFSTDLAGLVAGPLRLARLDLASRRVEPIAGFLTGKHVSPQVSPDGRTVTFVADPDGVANIYRMSVAGGPIEQLTTVATGVSGITPSSPALSMAQDSGRLAFSVFEEGGTSVYTLDPSAMVAVVPPAASARGALLPPRTVADGPLQRLLTDQVRGLPPVAAAVTTVPYPARLELEGVGPPTIAVGVASTGAWAGGGVSAEFRDTLGDHWLSAGVQIAGTWADLGGWVAFVNRRSRVNWGAILAQTPYRAEFLTATTDQGARQVTADLMTERQMSRGVSLVTALPFDRARRVEVTGGIERLSFGREHRVALYDLDSGALRSRSQERSTPERPIVAASARAAFVADTSVFGATGPLYGRRLRIEAGGVLGSLTYGTALIDLRQYAMPVRPVTLALRAVHLGRYGADAGDRRLVPYFLGYADVLHGYGFGSFDGQECGIVDPPATASGTPNTCAALDHLSGSRIAVLNVEVRAPLNGLLRGRIEYGRVPVDVVTFVDAGVAWSAGQRPAWRGAGADTRGVSRSAGVALRVNVFGLLIAELALARPVDRPSPRWRWQMGIRQGF